MEIRAYRLSKRLGVALQQRKLSLAVAESCTGGGLARIVTAVSGSSQWFERGFVTYSNAAKIELLGVDPQMIDRYGGVSKEVTYEMAVGTLKHSHADISLSITGIAGPDGGSADKPIGLVWFGLAERLGACKCLSKQFSGGRKHVRNSAVEFALLWLLETVLALNP